MSILSGQWFEERLADLVSELLRLELESTTGSDSSTRVDVLRSHDCAAAAAAAPPAATAEDDEADEDEEEEYEKLRGVARFSKSPPPPWFDHWR